MITIVMIAQQDSKVSELLDDNKILLIKMVAISVSDAIRGY